MSESYQSSTQLLYAQLIDLIKSGRYAVGDRFLTELEICEQFNVGRSTVREAEHLLQGRGFIHVRRGSGTYVTSLTGSEGNGNIGSWLIDNQDKLEDYMEVRIAVELLSTRLFIKRSTPEKVAALEQALSAFEDAYAAGDENAMSLADEAFHAAIANGTNNDLLININNLLADSFREYRHTTFANKSTRAAAVAAHRSITDSIVRRDTSDAVYKVQEHLTDSVENAIHQKTEPESL